MRDWLAACPSAPRAVRWCRLPPPATPRAVALPSPHACSEDELQCVLVQPLEQLIDSCLALEPKCQSVVYKQAGAYQPTEDAGTFRAHANRTAILAHPTAVLYLRQQPQQQGGGSGGLSAGAIAGIAVGATAAAAAVAAGCWVVARRRRKLARPADSSASGKVLEEGGPGNGQQSSTGTTQAPSGDFGSSCAGAAPQAAAAPAAAAAVAAAPAAAAAVAAVPGTELPPPLQQPQRQRPDRQASAGSSLSGKVVRSALPRGGSGPGLSPFEATTFDPFAASSTQTSRQASLAEPWSRHASAQPGSRRVSAQPPLPAVPAGRGGGSDGAPGEPSAEGTGSASQEAELPELAAYLAATRGSPAGSGGRRTAGSSAEHSSASGGGAAAAAGGNLATSPSLWLRSALPPDLASWLIDPNELTFLLHADGSRQTLGEGAGCAWRRRGRRGFGTGRASVVLLAAAGP